MQPMQPQVGSTTDKQVTGQLNDFEKGLTKREFWISDVFPKPSQARVLEKHRLFKAV